MKKRVVPMLFSGLKNLTELRHDLVAGFFVFLIALPLCMGIAMASGFPPVSGLLTAIIGGMIVPWLAGSNAQLTIKGPAAGLIAIAISCVNELGQGDLLKGYVCTLAVIVAAGIVQLLLALLRFGRFSDSVPLSVVHGMLAAIGIIIISKQTHVLLAAKVNEPDILKSLAAIPESILNIHPIAGGIGLLSLLILVMLPLIKSKNIKLIPPPLVALAVAVFAAHWFELGRVRAENLFGKTFALGPEYLVKLPASVASALTFPDFSKFLSITSVKYVVMFALVGSLETMLSAKAIDISDPWKRKSNLSRDLGAVAIGNIICGLTGGLPMISEIARSSANISYGARTARANFFHGFFMLLFISFFPSLLEQIPLSALAAMLVYTGFRLASPKEWLHMYRTGKEQLIVFVVTIVITLAIDLLAGIF
ncbi:MAG: SulP family inorganic anion transporter, partial [Chitinophagales bacterium]|nr:SulP family inorganic anion transporter [Chitinophagales bacterium]